MISQKIASCDRRELWKSFNQSGALCALAYPRRTDENDPSGFAKLLHCIRRAHRCLTRGTAVRNKLVLLVLEARWWKSHYYLPIAVIAVASQTLMGKIILQDTL